MGLVIDRRQLIQIGRFVIGRQAQAEGVVFPTEHQVADRVRLVGQADVALAIAPAGTVEALDVRAGTAEGAVGTDHQAVPWRRQPVELL